MTLSVYLKKRRITAVQCARELGVEPKTVYRHVHGDRFPCHAMILRYYSWSKGAIRPQDFYAGTMPDVRAEVA